MESVNTNVVLRSYKKLTKAEKAAFEDDFKDHTKGLYDYLLALGWIPLLLFALIGPIRPFWYIGLVLTVIAFVILQMLRDKKYAQWLLKAKKMRDYREFLISNELAGMPEAIDLHAESPTLDDEIVRKSRPMTVEELGETPIE